MQRFQLFLGFLLLTLLASGSISQASNETASLSAQHWAADNGNGTYSNPLFYEEFEDPDPIRVGNDYYLAGRDRGESRRRRHRLHPSRMARSVFHWLCRSPGPRTFRDQPSR